MDRVTTMNERNMAVNIQLDIKWDGPISGLSDHRLSLTAFGPALEKLLTAAKRIASNTLTRAGEPSETGRLAKLAHSIDIQIGGITEGSSGIATLVTFDAPSLYQNDLFFSLPEKVGLELVDSIEAESRGEYRNSAVRQFLAALPRTLTSHNYKLHENGRLIKDVTLGEVNLPEGTLLLPYLQEIVGMVTGVGFDPGRDEVRLKSDDAQQVTAVADVQQVNKALGLRHEKVRALVLQQPELGARLLRLTESESRRDVYSEDEYIFGRWDRAFQELA